MRVVLMSRAADELVERRRQLGLDRQDEMWNGEYHVAPDAHAFHGLVIYRLLACIEPAASRADLIVGPSLNIGTPQDYRVPDFALHHRLPDGIWIPGAPLVGEVLSPEDDTWAKFPFYREHEVQEIIVADYRQHRVRLFRAAIDTGRDYAEVAASELLHMTALEIADIDWP